MLASEILFFVRYKFIDFIKIESHLTSQNIEFEYTVYVIHKSNQRLRSIVDFLKS